MAEHPFDIAQRGFDTWKAKEHNKKWFRLIDGTPIPNDLVVCIAMEFVKMSSSHKDVPEYDEAIVCENPECKHIGAPAITGLYGMAGGGGVGVYTVCEHCGTVLSKSIDPELCDSHEVEIKNVEDNQVGHAAEPNPRSDSHD